MSGISEEIVTCNDTMCDFYPIISQLAISLSIVEMYYQHISHWSYFIKTKNG
jgi:hypothetical protein